MLMPDAIAAKKKRWALVYPNFEYGQSAAANFKTCMKKAQPDVEFVTEQATPLGKVDAGAVRRRSTTPSPTPSSTSCSAPISPSSCARAIRAACSRTASSSACCPASRNISTRSRTKPRSAGSSPAIPGTRSTRRSTRRSSPPIRSSWNDYPRLGSIVGYVTMKSIAAGIAKAGSTDTEKLIAAFRGLKLDSPFGPFVYRASDHQATMGAYVGKIALKAARAPCPTSNMSTAPPCCRRRRGEEASSGGCEMSS